MHVVKNTIKQGRCKIARIRTIKPDFFLHTELAALSPLHRLLFIGLWTQADKKGRLSDNPRKIRATILPYEEGIDVNQMLDDLQNDKGKFITRYSVNKLEKYIQINKFEVHQRPHHTEQESIIPPPLTNGKGTVKERLSNGSETDIKGREGKGKEGKEYTPEFEEFWKECLKREDKKYTFTCYQKRLSEGIPHVQILEHIKAYSKKHKEEKTEVQFIKNPSTFLNKTEFREVPNYSTTQKGEIKLADKYQTL